VQTEWRGGNDKVMWRQHKFKQNSTELIVAKTLTRFTLFSQRFVLRCVSTSHHHLARVNGIFHHHRFLRIEFRLGSKTFEEPFAATHSVGFNNTLHASLNPTQQHCTISDSDSRLLTALYFTSQEATANHCENLAFSWLLAQLIFSTMPHLPTHNSVPGCHPCAKHTITSSVFFY